jgi:hypothetical protein
MATRTISTAAVAEDAAMAYLAGAYPELMWSEPACLRLEAGWLVEAVAVALHDGGGRGGFATPGEPTVRALVMVGPSGSVEELGQGTISRRSAHRGLASLHVLAGAEPVAS